MDTHILTIYEIKQCSIINLFKLLFLQGSQTTSLKFLLFQLLKTSPCFGKLQLKRFRLNRASVIFNHPSRSYFPSLSDGSGKTYFHPELWSNSWKYVFLYWSTKMSFILLSNISANLTCFPLWSHVLLFTLTLMPNILAFVFLPQGPHTSALLLPQRLLLRVPTR